VVSGYKFREIFELNRNVAAINCLFVWSTVKNKIQMVLLVSYTYSTY